MVPCALAALVVISIPQTTLGLTHDNIPAKCRSQCDKLVSLLNDCELNTDGSNVNDVNRSCFCDGSNTAGYPA